MRVLACGGRNFCDVGLLNRTLDEMHAAKPITLLIHGTARGADQLAVSWAKRKRIPVEGYRPDWKKFGNRAAGPIRNRRMLLEGKPDLVVAFPGGSGTRDMMKQARAAGVPVLEPRTGNIELTHALGGKSCDGNHPTQANPHVPT